MFSIARPRISRRPRTKRGPDLRTSRSTLWALRLKLLSTPGLEIFGERYLRQSYQTVFINYYFAFIKSRFLGAKGLRRDDLSKLLRENMIHLAAEAFALLNIFLVQVPSRALRAGRRIGKPGENPARSRHRYSRETCLGPLTFGAVSRKKRPGRHVKIHFALLSGWR